MNFRFLFDNAACSIFFCSVSEKQDTSFSFVFGRLISERRRRAGIKTKSSVQVLFFKKQVKMQLLNSNIPQGAQTTRYGNKKAQDLLNLVAFSYYKDGSPCRVCKERSDGIAIVRTFQTPPSSLNRKSAIASPTTRRRRKPAMGKKRHHIEWCLFCGSPCRV